MNATYIGPKAILRVENPESALDAARVLNAAVATDGDASEFDRSLINEAADGSGIGAPQSVSRSAAHAPVQHARKTTSSGPLRTPKNFETLPNFAAEASFAEIVLLPQPLSANAELQSPGVGQRVGAYAQSEHEGAVVPGLKLIGALTLSGQDDAQPHGDETSDVARDKELSARRISRLPLSEEMKPNSPENVRVDSLFSVLNESAEILPLHDTQLSDPIGRRLQNQLIQVATAEATIAATALLHVESFRPARSAQYTEDLLQIRISAFDRPADKIIEVYLDPPELGRISIELADVGAGAIKAIVTAEHQATLDFFRRNAEHLSQELSRYGFPNVDLNFSDRNGGAGSSAKRRPNDEVRVDVSGGSAGDAVAAHFRSLVVAGYDRLV